MPSRTVYLETFGCQMNELDSELVSGSLRALGYRFTTAPGEADVVLYNTCSVREHAEQKVWSRLGELALRKKEDPGLVVGVLGCMAERDGVSLIRRMPVVDVLCGPGELDKLPVLIDNAVKTRESLLSDASPEAPPADRRSAGQTALQGSTSRRSATLAAASDSLEMLDLSRSISPADDDGPIKRSAYVRITRGCNKFCTYCVVPFTRGAEIHRPPEHIIDECKKLVDAGVTEITLLGQTVNHYRFEHGSAVTVNGVMQPQKGRSYAGGHRRDPFAGERVTTFADLLRRIHDEVPALARLRFVTSYPRDFGDDVLEVIRDHPRICRYLHVPAQSGSDRLLKLMNRGYTIGEYEEFLARARAILDQPELGRPLMVSGDIITGFPTETEEDHVATADLLRRARYKNAFIFKYSPRPGTVAFDKLADDVPEDVKRRRNNELLAIQSEISDQISREQVGREFSVIVEGLSRHERKRRPAASAKAGPGAVKLTIGGQPADGSDHGGSACALDAEVSHVHSPPTEPPASIQLSARTDGDLIVFFDAPARALEAAQAMIGSIVRVRVDRAEGLGLHGVLLG
ncbi:MAG: MiaB/RimO family radical SAM methylthiotransferase [Planctomycetota bacterium]|nr:MiaB/RimO family radical SAM methylthiotransferase [Planctomycetota bacterium]